ncbi:MAG: hypothetical protein V4615_05110 [Bacteroidota bacterium]
MKIYHNTTGLVGEELKEAVQRAKFHNEAILSIFLNTRQGYGPSQIHKLLTKAGRKIDINSVRRGITDMTTKTKDLVKTSQRRPGQYHTDPEYVWQINPIKYPSQQGEQTALFNNEKAA